MRRIPPTLALVSILAVGSSGCIGNPSTEGCAEGIDLEVPCTSEFERIDRVETDGAACGRAFHRNGRVHIEGAAAGTCRFTLVMESGERLDFSAELAPNCGTLFYGKPSAPYPARCPDAPDAGPCSGQTSCLVDPANGTEPGLCSLWCTPGNGRSCSVPVMGARAGECAEACACFSGSTVDGCTTDSDCVITQADCCGCARGGTSWAVVASTLSKWESNLCHQRDAGCNDLDNRCVRGARAFCDQGRCLIGDKDGGQ